MSAQPAYSHLKLQEEPPRGNISTPAVRMIPSGTCPFALENWFTTARIAVLDEVVIASS